MVGAVEEFAHPSHQVQRLLKLAASWPEPQASADEPVRHLTHRQLRTARQLRPEEVDRLIEEFRTGASIRELAHTYRVYRTTIGQHLRARGIDTRPFTFLPEDVEDASQLYRDGWTLDQVALKYQVGNETIRARLVANGVTMRPRGRHSRR
ncbi:hypothetical protein DMA12_27555 [Amycolatopsis balhimycina DSM 5908]|uniref:Helix-turn-helix domain containing protein n=1 Tax=Amycolatopsis balhimycina DSM 5908 TaxID=1081091 RepID=A0A428WAS1_AMYBA|nr:hypothetical protein DMA12_27555 [Amycolatopsis balhimycina DSM 5908]